MLRWAFAFFVLALISALFGFSGLDMGAVEAARVLFFGFLGLCMVSFVIGVTRAGKRSTV